MGELVVSCAESQLAGIYIMRFAWGVPWVRGGEGQNFQPAPKSWLNKSRFRLVDGLISNLATTGQFLQVVGSSCRWCRRLTKASQTCTGIVLKAATT